MKKLFIAILVLFLSFPLLAQQRTGNIYGKVVDAEGNPLPGVTVTLTGRLIAPMTSTTSAEGLFRFISLSPSRDYSLKAELQGFKPKTESGIIVTIGANVEMTLVLEMGALTEEVTVTASTPVVDSKKTTVGQVVSQEMLQSLPTSRDPFTILQLVPSVQLDRADVGGSESGGQAGQVARGQRSYFDNIWAIDGAMITDVSSTASAIYFDFDSFEEMQVTVGGADVTQQTGGIGVNLVTRRGGNNLTLGGRFFFTEEYFQADNLTDALRAEGIKGVNKVVDIKDYGFNLGGPLIKDKVWWWGSFGVQDIKTNIIEGTPDNTLLQNFNGKLNLQLLPQNRLEIYGTVAKKEKWGRGASYSTPFGSHQENFYHFGSPVVKIQDEHMFGDNLFVSAKFTWVNSGFSMAAMYNEDTSKIGLYNVTDSRWDQAYGKSGSSRSRYDGELTGIYFNDSLLGVGHEVKFGFYYSERGTYSISDSYPYFYYKYNTPQFDITGDSKADVVPNLYQLRTGRFSKSDSGQTAIAAYFQDTVTTGRFNFILGLRWDEQMPWVPSYPVLYNAQNTFEDKLTKDAQIWKDNFTAKTSDVLSALLPTMTVTEVKPDYSWTILSPRLGITWDVQGNGKTIAKLFYGQYGEYMATGEAGSFRPLGTGGSIYYWWLDTKEDKICDYTELYWHDKKTLQPFRVFDDAGNFIGDWAASSGVMWSAFDPANPTQTTAPTYKVDKDAGTSRSREILASLERELGTDLGVSLNFTYKTYDRSTWDLDYYPATGHYRTKDDYVVVGHIPSAVGGISTGEAAGRPYYLLRAAVAGETDYTAYRNTKRTPDLKDIYKGLDFVVNKRLSKKWMMNASFTLQSQVTDYGAGGYLDPTNVWATDKCVYSTYMGAAGGKVSQYLFSRWLVKVAGLYQLPWWDMNISATFLAREGNIIAETFTIYDYTAPNANNRSISVYMNKFGKLRLPTFYTIDLRLEKMLRVGSGKAWIMADAFNLLNSSVINRRYQRNLGTYYVYADPSLNRFVPDATCFRANEVANPRLVRFGIRFSF